MESSVSRDSYSHFFGELTDVQTGWGDRSFGDAHLNELPRQRSPEEEIAQAFLDGLITFDDADEALTALSRVDKNRIV